MLTILRRVFNFSDHELNHPGEPPPGNMLDASFDAQNQRIAELESLLDSVRRSDGALNNGIVTKDSLDPAFFTELSAKIAKIGELLMEKADSAARRAENAANVALFASKDVENNKIEILRAESTISPLETDLKTAISGLKAAEEAVQSHVQAVASRSTLAVEATESSAGYSEAWAESSRLWAEHMPDTLPDNALKMMDITGDHWSSRWWANRAANAFGMLSQLYLGAHPSPPTTDNNGGALIVGSLYYNTTTGQAYIWNGSAWVPLWTPAQTMTLTLWYVATAGQTVIDTKQPDINGRSYVLSLTDPEGVEVHVNGLLKEPDLSGPGGDYSVTYSASTVTFLTPLTAGQRVAIDVMIAPSKIRPGAVLAWKMALVEALDGARTIFTLDVVDPIGPAPPAVTKPENLLISVDGVIQAPGIDYQAVDATLTFSTAPASDSVIFVTWFQSIGSAGGGGGDMAPADILAALKTVDGAGSGLDADFLDGLDSLAFAKIAGATFTGKVTVPAGTAASAGLTIPHSSAPTVPVPGDIWTTASGDLFWNCFQNGVLSAVINGKAQTVSGAKTFTSSPILPTPPASDNSTKGATTAYVDAADALKANVADLAAKLNLSGGTMTGKLVAPGTTANAGINLGNAAQAPSAPADGDIWIDFGQTLKWRAAGSTLTVVDANFQQSIAGAKSFTSPISPPPGTSAAPGVNIGTNTGIYGAAGTSLGITVNGVAKLVCGVSTSSFPSGHKLVPGVSTTTRAGLNLNNGGTGVAPTTPAEGDFWMTTAGLFAYVNGATQKIGPGWTQMTQAAYDALTPKDPNMLYVIVG